MKQHRTASNSQRESQIHIDKGSAYHQAGRATAIYLGNKLKRLPAVHFQIIITQQDEEGQHFSRLQDKYTAKVEGGRLIQSLPLSFSGLTQDFSWQQQEEFRSAFEADVINVLAGSLAEAKYIALRDDEVFNANLVNIAALRFYGGDADIELITDYMECFMPDKAERDRKLIELFLAAFSFVNKHSNWYAIAALAKYIRDQPKAVIGCEEVMALLESRLAA